VRPARWRPVAADRLSCLRTDLSLVNIGNARLYGMETELGLTGNQYQVAVSILFVTYCVSLLTLPVGASTTTNDA
jgi:hypothetical protein